MAKPLIVLDIDQTLLHAGLSPLQRPWDFTTTYNYVYKRPFVDSFLNFCTLHFDIAIWTNAGTPFAEQIVKKLFGTKRPLRFVKTKQHCDDHKGVLVKDLNKLKQDGYCLSNVIMVDDTPQKLQLTPKNLIAVKPFWGETDDCDLRHLITYLKYLLQYQDIGHHDKSCWKQEICLCTA